ncbi:insulinase family protein [Haloimpatiens sp. FM7315]|uniref:insulinase family protein n=1 Tax=Haloimpatiens sp. FM7315 TaxID=3298609 RepID=UPI0035A2C641
MNLKTNHGIFKKLLSIFMAVSFIFISVPYPALAASKTELKVGNTYEDFKLIKRDYVKSIKSYVNQFQHKKTGAKLIYIENSDEQKMFSVTFRTPCFNDTGVNHILEHSVLCGSEKFPVKNPFAKLLNKSLNTEMNAYTYQDKTSYPVASKYDKDFKNLVTVYLDAVFSPNITKTKNIFNQEGWRYEIDSKSGEIKYNGVVFNEMKGAYSKPEEVLSDSIKQSLFPDTCYKYQSGGNPKFIPNLTYEKYLEVYKKYYHPSNSYTYIYGKVDILNMLKYINDNYFSKYEKKAVDSKITLQKPFEKQKNLEAEYSIPKEVSEKNKTYFSLNYVVSNINNSEDNISLGLINYLMFNSKKAPVKNALKKAGFNEVNFSASVMDIFQPVESITLKNANIKDKEKFNKVVKEAYKDIIEKGFDKKDVKDLLNERLKNSKLSKAFDNFLSLNAITTEQCIGKNWIYGGDPTLYLDDKKVVQNIKNKIDNGERYFEEYLKKYFLNNNHSSFVTLKPKVGLEEKISEDTKKALEKYKSSLSQSKLNDLIKNCNEFKVWQNTPDSKEALSSLPKLSLEDLKKPVVNYPTEEKSVNGVKILNHFLDTKGASYIKLYFNTKNVPKDKLCYVNLLSQLYGIVERELNTKNYTKDKFNEITKKEEITITSIENTMTKYNDDSIYKPMLTVGVVCPTDSIKKSMSLVEEMLFKTKLNDKENIKEEVKKAVELYKESKKQGSIMALSRLKSYYSPSSKYSYELDKTYEDFLKNLDENFHKNIDDVIKNLNEVKNLVLNKENLIVSFTSGEENYSTFEKGLKNFSKSLGEEKFIPCDYKFESKAKNEAYITDEKVQTVVKGYNFNKLGYKYTGTLDIVRGILNDYLFNTVRVKNGAYGAQALISQTGDVMLASFNDPNLKKTLDIFNTSGDYIKNLKLSDSDLKEYIIASLGQYDVDVPPALIGSISDGFYIFGDNASDMYKRREEILNTTLEDINKCGDMINEVLKENTYCVAGNRKTIEENKNLFTKIIDVSKEINNSNFVRLQGKNRYKTACEVAKTPSYKADYDIIASGEDYKE